MEYGNIEIVYRVARGLRQWSPASNPKAVMLSHRNLTWTAAIICDDELNLSHDDVLLSYLPLSHIAEQMISIHGPLHSGACVWFAESIDKLPVNLKEAQPTVFVGVPRVWEKIQQRIINQSAQQGLLKQTLFKFYINQFK